MKFVDKIRFGSAPAEPRRFCVRLSQQRQKQGGLWQRCRAVLAHNSASQGRLAVGVLPAPRLFVDPALLSKLLGGRCYRGGRPRRDLREAIRRVEGRG